MSYSFVLIFILLAGAHAQNENNNIMTFSHRVQTYLERTCMTNADKNQYKSALQSFNDFVNNCHQLDTAQCQIHANKCVDRLTNFGDQIEPCLKNQSYLKRIIIDIYNKSSTYYCNNIEKFGGTTELREGRPECQIDVKAHPELSPQVACFQNSSIIGDRPKYAASLENLCNDVRSYNFCYNIIYGNCHEDIKTRQFQTVLIYTIMEECIDFQYIPNVCNKPIH